MLVAALCVCQQNSNAQASEFRLLDATPTGQPGNGNSESRVDVSGNGRFVAFVSTSNNLVPGDANGQRDVFVHDLWAGSTEIASIATDGTQTDHVSVLCDLSVDGRYVVFLTWAKSLDPGDQDNYADLYVRDRVLGITEWISSPHTASMSAGNAGDTAGISDDGRFVAFASDDPSLVPNDFNGYADVFVRDRMLQTTDLVSVSTSGLQGNLHSGDPLISADGGRVLFQSKATNFHPSADPSAPGVNHLYLRDMGTGVTQAIDLDPNGNLPRKGVLDDNYDLSPDGACIVFLGDGFLTGQYHFGHLIWREGRSGFETIGFPDGTPGWGMEQPRLSWDGRYVAFKSGLADWSPNPASFTNVFLHDTQLSVTSIVSSLAPGIVSSGSYRPSLSHDGRVVGFITSSPAFTGQSSGSKHYAFARICDVTPGLTFCFPSRSPVGCLPTLRGSGTPSATSGTGHDLVVADARNDQIGLFFYGTSGDQALPFGSGWLCLAGSLSRMAVQPTGGTPPPAQDCSGTLHADFNAWVASGADPSLTAGTAVYVQSWSRDPSLGFGALLSDAAAFVLGP